MEYLPNNELNDLSKTDKDKTHFLTQSNENETLMNNIRSSIRRLCKMQNSSKLTELKSEDISIISNKDKEFNELITKFQLSRIEADIQEQKNIIANIILKNSKYNDSNKNNNLEPHTTQQLLKECNKKLKVFIESKEYNNMHLLSQSFDKNNDLSDFSENNKTFNFLKKKVRDFDLNRHSSPNQYENEVQNQTKLFNDFHKQSTISDVLYSNTDENDVSESDACDSAISKSIDSQISIISQESEQSFTPISSKRFRLEIDDIGARLAKIRESLLTGRKQLKENNEETKSIILDSKSENSVKQSDKLTTKINIERVSLVSVDSAGYYSSDGETIDNQNVEKIKTQLSQFTNVSPISGIERLDLSNLNSPRKTKKSENFNWTEIEIYPRPNQQQQQQLYNDNNQRQKIKQKTNQNHSKNSNSSQRYSFEHQMSPQKLLNSNRTKHNIELDQKEIKRNFFDKYPKWLTLVPNTTTNEFLTNNFNKQNLQCKKKISAKSRKLLRLSDESTKFHINNLNIKQNETMKQNSSSLLFACDMSKTQINYLLNKASLN